MYALKKKKQSSKTEIITRTVTYTSLLYPNLGSCHTRCMQKKGRKKTEQTSGGIMRNFKAHDSSRKWKKKSPRH